MCASAGRLVPHNERAEPHGDPMEVALHVLALRAGVDVTGRQQAAPTSHRCPFDRQRPRYGTVAGDTLYVKGAPEAVLSVSVPDDRAVRTGVVAHEMAELGLRVLAVATRTATGEAVAACRTAGIRLGLITGDHAGSAHVVAGQVGLLRADPAVINATDLPAEEAAPGELSTATVWLSPASPRRTSCASPGLCRSAGTRWR